MDLVKILGLIVVAVIGMPCALVLAVANPALRVPVLVVVGVLIVAGVWCLIRVANSPSRPPE
ncbi:hypothetical protein [Nonomuraea rubra]|jgi:hypothetical protein|uniref:Cation transport ATPase n=1 Tax=Nonomuraea rubra TaxID=46180 RepID=A0A7X0U633_9ACTN|nr:hypothetical protein [Nonomuraea rubra]MBB6556110.1 cation transport ATPase [Nonomuraea rubra]